MKIKTKRGARRMRNQRVITRRFVTTDYTGCSHITAGKLYKVKSTQGGKIKGFNIDNDDGFPIFTNMVGSCHLDDVGVWRYATI